jgi:hypothetical protein
MSRKQRRAAENRQQNPKPQTGGPRTPEGKAVSSQNAFSHGLTAARLVLPWENQEEFATLLNQLVAEHRPATATEGLLVREIGEQYWRLQRARNHEHALLLQTPEVLDKAETDPALYEAWNKQLTLAQRYVTRHERAFHKCLATLRTLQKERRSAEAEAETEAPTPAPSTTNARPAPPNQFVSQNQFVSPNARSANAAAPTIAHAAA